MEALEQRQLLSGLVYRTAIDPISEPFEVYNTRTQSWTSLGTVTTGANLAVSGAGELYMLNYASNMIQQYNSSTNTWTNVRSGPPVSIGYGNLEVTKDGEFFASQSSRNSGDATKLYYTSGGTWHSLTLPGRASALGDYDPTLDKLVISQENSETIWEIDPHTLAITTFSSGASQSTSETRRFGEIYNGQWYTEYHIQPIRRFDLSNSSASMQTVSAQSPGYYSSAAVDPSDGIFYVNPYGDTTFRAWNPATDSFTSLPSAPTPNSHNTLAFVPEKINHAPVVGGVASLTQITDKQTTTPFSTVTITDADSPAQTLTVTVALDSADKGTLSNLGGFVEGPTGTYTFTGVATAAQAAIRGLVFTPEENRVAPTATEDTTFAVSVSDGIATSVETNLSVEGTVSLSNALAAPSSNFHPQGMGYDPSENRLLFLQQNTNTVYVADLTGTIVGSRSIQYFPTYGTAQHTVSVAADASRYYFSDYTANTSGPDLYSLDKASGIATRISAETAAYGGYPIDVRNGMLYRTQPSNNYNFGNLNQIRVSTTSAPDTILRTLSLDTPQGIADFSVDDQSNALWTLDYSSNASIRQFDLSTGQLVKVFNVGLDGLDAGFTYAGGKLYYYNWNYGSGSTLTTYRVDSLASVPAVVRTTSVNDAPVVSGAISNTTDEGAPGSSVDLLAGASDVDTGDVLSVSGLTFTGDASGITVDGNSLTIDPSAYNALAVGESAVITYSYDVIDGNGGVVSQTATITIEGRNDAPTASAASLNATEDGSAVTTGVLTGDVDGDDTPETLLYTIVTPPLEGSALDNGDGTFTFSPGADFQDLAARETREVSFTYKATDRHGLESATATVTITVTGTNDAPQVTSGTQLGAVTEDGITTVGGTISYSDADTSDTHTAGFTPQDSGYLGTFSLDPVDRTSRSVGWSFSVDDAALQFLAAGQVLTQQYTVSADDGHGGTVAQTVTVTITGTNDTATIGGTAAGALTEDGAANVASGRLSVSDVDSGEAVFRPAAALSGTYGSFTFDPATGDWTYTLDNSKAATQALRAGQQVTDTLTVKSFDGTATQLVTVTITGSNDAPVVGAIAGLTQAPIDITSATIHPTASFVDPDLGDTLTAVWTWGDGTNSTDTFSNTAGSGSLNGSHTYAGAGVYRVTVTLTDAAGASDDSVFEYVVVYNTDNGFVTGGGWINSPAGAYRAAPTLTGKANFGFVSKYKNGTSTPTGNTQFTFGVADFNFLSTSYEWLVIAGAKAQYKGEGTVNGQPGYGFMLTAIDGEISGGGGVDKFRIKIWNKATGAPVYDNNLGAADDSNPTTSLGGGSIVIHKNLVLSAGEDVGQGSAPILTPEALAPVAREAIARWQAAGLDEAGLDRLRQVQVVVANLEGSTLGHAGVEVIYVDQDAGGYGWFTDVSPAGDLAFNRHVAADEFLADASSPAAGHVDLLTLLMHEMGHVVGLDDLDPQEHPHDLMTEDISTGMRRLPHAGEAGGDVAVVESTAVINVVPAPTTTVLAAPGPESNPSRNVPSPARSAVVSVPRRDAGLTLVPMEMPRVDLSIGDLNFADDGDTSSIEWIPDELISELALLGRKSLLGRGRGQ